MKDLQRAFKLVHDEVKKAEHRIDWINRIMEYWCDARAEAIAYLDGLYKAYDIMFKEIYK